MECSSLIVNYGYAEYRKSSREYDGKYYKVHNSDLNKLPAGELIKHYVLSKTSYPIAVAYLKEKYGNTQDVAKRLLHKVKTRKP